MTAYGTQKGALNQNAHITTWCAFVYSFWRASTRLRHHTDVAAWAMFAPGHVYNLTRKAEPCSLPSLCAFHVSEPSIATLGVSGFADILTRKAALRSSYVGSYRTGCAALASYCVLSKQRAHAAVFFLIPGSCSYHVPSRLLANCKDVSHVSLSLSLSPLSAPLAHSYTQSHLHSYPKGARPETLPHPLRNALTKAHDL